MTNQIRIGTATVFPQLLVLIATAACDSDFRVQALSRSEAKRRTADGYSDTVPPVVMLWARSGPAREVVAPYLDLLIRQGATVNMDQLRVIMAVNEDSVLTLALCEETRGASANTILSRFILACRFRDAVAIAAKGRSSRIDGRSSRPERDDLDQTIQDWSDGLLPWATAIGFHRFFDVSKVDDKRLAGSLFKCEAAGLDSARPNRNQGETKGAAGRLGRES